MESNLQSVLLAVIGAIEGAPEPNPAFIKESWLAYAAYLENAGHPQLADHISQVAHEAPPAGQPSQSPPRPPRRGRGRPKNLSRELTLS